MKLLHIDSSILADKSVTRELSTEVVAHYKSQDPDIEVIRYDLNAAPVPFLSSMSFTDEGEQKIGERVMDDFMAADILVMGVPMYNFGVPAQLKSWLDRIAVAGKTFKYTENGPVGLVSGKKIVILSSRGGVYSGEMSFLDHQEAHLKALFGLFGLNGDDITIIRAEGVNLGPDEAKQAMAQAKSEIQTLKL